MRNPRRSLTTTLATLLLGAGLTLAVATPAQAHDELVSSYPEANSTLTSSPAEITLSFSGELIAGMQSAAVEVIASDGENIATDAPSEDGTSITQQLTPNPPDGLFTVRWKVVSSDGHPISGEYTYTVAPTDAVPSSPAATPSTAPQTPAPTATATVTPADNGYGGETSGGGDTFAILAVVGGMIILGGALVIVLMVGRERRRRDRADAARAARDTTAGKDSTDES
ncbi:copper resistance CopC family protein [uncultured Microbacterium sp.]|uniref:copper resistance CopC family protein n=1 Tax=uncultured Microbacterium sp. TaxID=191216 RepID=UPI0026313B19|nr:copper resistance CopC family protein [uncultured Microbacterium sp.]